MTLISSSGWRSQWMKGSCSMSRNSIPEVASSSGRKNFQPQRMRYGRDEVTAFGSTGHPAPLHSFTFKNEDVRLNSTWPLNSHGQSLFIWRKLDMLCVGHLAISLLRELESAGIQAARRRHGARWRVRILCRVVLAVKLHIFRGVLCLIDEGKAVALIGLDLEFGMAGLFAGALPWSGEGRGSSNGCVDVMDGETGAVGRVAGEVIAKGVSVRGERPDGGDLHTAVFLADDSPDMSSFCSYREGGSLETGLIGAVGNNEFRAAAKVESVAVGSRGIDLHLVVHRAFFRVELPLADEGTVHSVKPSGCDGDNKQ